MKQIILILLLFTIGVHAQKEFGNPDDYDPVTSILDGSTLQLRQSGKTRTIYWPQFKSLLGSGSSLLTQQNTWQADQAWLDGGILLSAGGYLQFSTSYKTGLSRQFFFPANDSTAWIYINGQPYELLTKNKADGLYSTDTTSNALNNTYMTLSTSQTGTGAKEWTGTWSFSNKMKVWSGPSWPTVNWYGVPFYNTTLQKWGFSLNNYSFSILASEQFVIDNAVTNVGGVVEDSLQAQSHFFSASLDYPQNNENLGLFKTPFAMNIVSVDGVITSDGGSNDSVRVNVRWGTTRTTATEQLFYNDEWVSSLSGKSLTGDLYGTSISIASWVWVETTNLVGTVKNLLITVEYTRP